MYFVREGRIVTHCMDVTVEVEGIVAAFADHPKFISQYFNVSNQVSKASVHLSNTEAAGLSSTTYVRQSYLQQ